MAIREIRRAEWRSFLAGFSGQHLGWLVSLDVTNPKGGAPRKTGEAPLVDVRVANGEPGQERVQIVLQGRAAGSIG